MPPNEELPGPLKTLQNAIKAAFKKPQDEALPDEKDPEFKDKITALQEKIRDQLAEDLANAIKEFVQKGTAMNIKTKLEVDPNTGELTGTQTAGGEIKFPPEEK